MVRTGHPPLAAVLVSIVAIHPLAGQALAFSPAAAQQVAARLPQALPTAAHWDAAWDGLVATAVEKAAADEEAGSDLEAAALRHRFDARRVRAGLAVEPADRIGGLAPFVLAERTALLERAFAARDSAAMIEAAAALAASVADLADPFLMTPSDPEEDDGARAWFSEVDEIGAIEGGGIRFDAAADPTALALAMASESASVRAAIEEAARHEDATALGRLRDDRLAAALSLARRLMRQAWLRAGSPDLAGDVPGASVAWVRPNPARAGAILTFTSKVSGEARLELFDVAGRRVAERSLGVLPRGLHEVALDERGVPNRGAGVYLARVTVGGEALGARFVQGVR